MTQLSTNRKNAVKVPTKRLCMNALKGNGPLNLRSVQGESDLLIEQVLEAGVQREGGGGERMYPVSPRRAVCIIATVGSCDAQSLGKCSDSNLSTEQSLALALATLCSPFFTTCPLMGGTVPVGNPSKGSGSRATPVEGRPKQTVARSS